MTETRSRTGLLLPPETLVLLGAGTQGAAAIQNYGFLATPDFWEEFALLEERLQGSEADDASAQLAVSRAIVAAAHDASAWVSIRSDAAEIAPAIVLIGPRAVVAAVLHGAAVEYIIGEVEILARITAAAVTTAASSVLDIAVFDEDESIAALRFENGVVDIAAKDQVRLERLSVAAGEGHERLFAEFAADLAGISVKGTAS